MLESLPVPTIVAGINNMLEVLERRGVIAYDWDKKERELYRLKVFGNKVYFLAAEIDEI